MRRLAQLCAAALLVSAAACDRADNRAEPGAQGTAGAVGDMTTKSGGTMLTGCLEKNMSSGQFELVMEGDDARRAGDAAAGMKPGHDRLMLVTEGSVELNQHVGKRVTVEGTLGAGQPISDAGTRSYGAGEGADRSQTRSREGDSRRMTVTAVRNVGGTCDAEKR